MPTYTIRGIDVDFPFEAYDCQIVYMEKVIESLQEGRNALLESPTGTGKTLCLLCAALSWRKSLGKFSTDAMEERSRGSGGGSQPSSSQSTEHPRSDYPVIIYASRTHSQLKQVIRELKACNYRPKMSILGSREQMCIHDEVRQIRGRAQNNACHYVCKKRLCRRHTLVSEFMKKHNGIANEPFDIEDLVNIGRTKGPCPYYLSRELHKVVDILFAPYNYLIDPGNRRSLTGIQWSNAVLIFDEAHNLESICADAASFDLPSGYLTTCISEAKECIDLCVAKRAIENSADKHLDPDNYAILRALLLKLEKRIVEVAIGSKESGFTRPGNYIYEFLSDLNINYETANMLINTIDNAALLLEEGTTAETKEPIKAKGTICRLETIRDILNIIFRDGGKAHAKYYRFHVQDPEPSAANSLKAKGSRTLSWWCFNPGLAMEEFLKLGVRSIIMTSGTLSPLDSFAMELNLEFPVRLENPHVISPSQIWVGIVPTGPSGYPLNSSYRTRDSLEYKQELGNTIVNFARIVPDGLLVFFPSYYMMGQCIDCWKSMSHTSSADFITIWERICKYKRPVIEPKQSSLFSHAIEDFQTKLRDTSTSGAVFFAVCRGKVSEGLDFADRAGRAVVITGMPFSTMTDAKVRLKREYLDNQALSEKKGSKALTGEEWYVQQATRAVNQAVGRVIRHRYDYGAIILCDERFGQKNRQSQMSYWVRPHLKCYSKFGDVVFTLTRFFRDKDNIGRMQDKSSSSKAPTILAATSEHHSQTSSLLLDSTVGVDKCDQISQIVPANRSNLSGKPNCSSTSCHSGDQFSIRSKTEDSKNNKRCSHYQDDEGIVSVGGAVNGEQEPEDDATPSTKRQKTLQRENDSIDAVKFGDFQAERNNQADRITSQQVFQKKDANSNVPRGAEETKGSAFLMQVKEKLSIAEYMEFIGYMKALKSKTMKITPVLESIARLFSIPGRISLMERFRDFVPAKYHPTYEKLLSMYRTGSDKADAT